MKYTLHPTTTPSPPPTQPPPNSNQHKANPYFCLCIVGYEMSIRYIHKANPNNSDKVKARLDNSKKYRSNNTFKIKKNKQLRTCKCPAPQILNQPKRMTACHPFYFLRLTSESLTSSRLRTRPMIHAGEIQKRVKPSIPTTLSTNLPCLQVNFKSFSFALI